MEDRYVGFYPEQWIWLFEKPDLEDLIFDEDKFRKEFENEVFKFNNNDFSISICRDGFIMFRINSLEEIRENCNSDSYKSAKFNSDYLEYINAFYLLLNSENLNSEKFSLGNFSYSPNNIFKVNKKNDLYLGYSHNSLVHVFQSYINGRHLSLYKLGNPMFEISIIKRKILKEETINVSVNNFVKIFKDDDCVYVLSQINASLNNYKTSSFRQSSILSWFLIEYFINKYWVNYLFNNNPSYNKERREFLTGRDITAAIKLNMLEINNIISNEIFNKINELRSIRNKVVHDLPRTNNLHKILSANAIKNADNFILVNYEDCIKSFEVLDYFVKRDYDIDLKFDFNLSLGLI